MNLIENITTAANQTQSVVLPDGSAFTFTLYYSANQLGWFILNFVYNTFVLNGMRITTNPNLLYQYQNQLPFGVACFTVGQREPTQQQDFSSGASNLYLLSQAEVQAYTAYIEGGPLPS
jgi:hypothetical protein